MVKLLPGINKVNSFTQPAPKLVEILKNDGWRPLSFWRGFYVIWSDTSHWRILVMTIPRNYRVFNCKHLKSRPLLSLQPKPVLRVVRAIEHIFSPCVSSLFLYLFVSGGLLSLWKKHWCVLRDDTFMWFRGKQVRLNFSCRACNLRSQGRR